jgi:hypothetical protein
VLKFRTREQCEQFQMAAFEISCATCELWDQECPWDRRDEPTMVRSRSADVPSPVTDPSQQRAQKRAA